MSPNFMPQFISFFCYNIARSIFSLGFRVLPILNALDLSVGIRVFDAACGYGYMAKHLSRCDYVGMDNDSERIEWARKTPGENARRKFLVGNICRTGLPLKSFDRALGYGVLHHLDDKEVHLFANELNGLVRGRIVFSEPVYSRYHFINNWLCRLDAGKYVRQTDEYLNLLRPILNITRSEFFYARNGLAKFLLITCEPKENQAHV